ncbi:MAG: DUF3768 domain-containing protein [Rhodomicrobium sp.]
MNDRLAVARNRKCTHPTCLAQLERNAAYIARLDGHRHWRSSRVDQLNDLRQRARFGAVPLHRIYYDRKLEAHSEDAADPEKTCRVLTVMLAEEH